MAIVPPRQESAALDRPLSAPAEASRGMYRWTMARENPFREQGPIDGSEPTDRREARRAKPK